MSGPFRQWEDVICIPFADRNLNRLCNIIHYATLYAAPLGGASALAMVFGCNFVQLMLDSNDVWPIITKTVLYGVTEGRGFRHFGVLDSPDGEVADKAKEYLAYFTEELD